jgi:peptide/nickel transport system ATP-binding protein
MNLLEVENLNVEFRGDDGWLHAVDGVTFAVPPNASLGIVGESGSGKSVTALSILRLHAKRNTRLSGRILFEGRDLLRIPERDLRRVRGKDVAMVFQDPMHSLNPVLTIADQIGETLRIHQGLDARAARARAVDLLDLVRIPDAARRVDEYPHRLSGGQRQRVMIAIAIACRPKLLIADEPTTALDVTIQAQILDLLRDLREEIGMSVILISHDLGLVAEFAERVMVMYAGEMVEHAPSDALFRRPVHPYAEGLLSAIPSVDADADRLATIPGTIPEPGRRPEACRFAPRCPYVEATCHRQRPPVLRVAEGHHVRCPIRIPEPAEVS